MKTMRIIAGEAHCRGSRVGCDVLESAGGTPAATARGATEFAARISSMRNAAECA